LFEIPKSTFYERTKVVSADSDKYSLLRTQVTTIFEESRKSAGQRTIVKRLRAENQKATRHLVRRMMREEHLFCKQRRPNPYKPAEKPSIFAPNILNRKFNVNQPNTWWCGDMTYIWTRDGWRYLAVVLDLCVRKVVGFAFSSNPDTALTKKALMMAFESRGRPKNLTFHSDQGCHYTSAEFREQLADYGITQSMSRRGNCWDNAPMERFFGSLKSEWMPKQGYETFEEADLDLHKYIHDYYNSARPHTHNNGLPPNIAEATKALSMLAASSIH
jgi:putative transposase